MTIGIIKAIVNLIDKLVSPDAVNDYYSFKEGAAMGGNLLANDCDGILSNKMSLTTFNGAKLKNGITDIQGKYGTFHLKADGTFTYDLSDASKKLLVDGVKLTESINYKITNGLGATDTATLTLDINGVTNGPRAVHDFYDFTEGQTMVGNVLDNDTPGDNGKIFLRRVSDVAVDLNGKTTDVKTQYGTLHLKNDGSFTFDLDANVAASLHAGQTLVEHVQYYLISDGEGRTDADTITLTIHGTDGPGDLLLL